MFILLYASPKIFRKIKQRNDVEDEIPSTKPLRTDADHLLNLYQEVHDSDDEDKKNGYTELAEYIMNRKGYNLLATDQYVKTALHRACKNCQTDIALKIINALDDKA